MSHRDLRLFWLALSLAALLATGRLEASNPADNGLELYLTLGPSVISVDETATLTLEARGTGFGRFQAEPDFSLDNLKIVAGPHRSSSFNYVNGTTSRSLKYTWIVQPLEVGTGTVQGVQVSVRGQIYQLPDRSITIQTEPTGRSAPRSRPQDPLDAFFNGRTRRERRPPAEPDVFLRAEAHPAEPYVGQQVTYTIYVYSLNDITNTDPESLPDFKGMWVHNVPQPRELRTENVEWNGKLYGRVALMKKILFPLREGTIDIEPAGFRLLARLTDSSFFGPIMSRSEPIRRRSNAVTLNVQPLPTPPAGFVGAVGDLRYNAELSPSSIEQGEAATLTITLEGKGHIQGLPAPEIPELEGLRVYPPQQTSDSEVQGTQLFGRRSWSYVFVPSEAGEWTIPPLGIEVFDPSAAAYERIETAELNLSVAPAPNAEAVEEPIVAPEPSPRPDEATRWRTIAFLSLGLLALVIAVLGVRTLLRRRTGGGHSSEVQLRESLERIPETESPRKIAAAIESAWREFLSERWNIGPGQASTQWSRLLEDQGADREIAGELVRLADDLHYLRYAPQLSSTDELRRDLIDRSLRLARALR